MLEHDADALSHPTWRIPGIEPEHVDLAGVAPAVALQDLDRRRLACAVRSEDPEDLAHADLEVDPAHRLE